MSFVVIRRPFFSQSYSLYSVPLISLCNANPRNRGPRGVADLRTQSNNINIHWRGVFIDSVFFFLLFLPKHKRLYRLSKVTVMSDPCDPSIIVARFSRVFYFRRPNTYIVVVDHRHPLDRKNVFSI